jgi:hypothetical protein
VHSFCEAPPQRPGLPGKVLFFILCPLTLPIPPKARQGTFRSRLLSPFLLSPWNSLNFPIPFFGGPTWVRTRDLPVMSRWLFQLSYGPLSPLIIDDLQSVSTPSSLRSVDCVCLPVGRECGIKRQNQQLAI